MEVGIFFGGVLVGMAATFFCVGLTSAAHDGNELVDKGEDE